MYQLKLPVAAGRLIQANKKLLFTSLSCSSGCLAFSLVQKVPKRVYPTLAVSHEQTQFQKQANFTVQDLLKYLKPFWKKIVLAALFAIAASYLNIQIPLSLGHLVDKISKFLINQEPLPKEEFLSLISTPLKRLFTLYLSQAICKIGLIATLHKTGEDMSTELKSSLYAKIIENEMAYFDANKSQNLNMVIESDVQEFKHAFKSLLSVGITSLTQTIGCAVALYNTSPELTTSLSLALPIMISFGRILSSGLRKLSVQQRKEQAVASEISGQGIEQIQTVKLFAAERFENAKFRQQLEKANKTSSDLGYGIACFQGLSNFALNSIVALTVAFGGSLVNENKLSGGDLMAFLAASQMAQRSLMQFSQLAAQWVKLVGAGERIKTTLNYYPCELSKRGDITKPMYAFLGNFEFRNVCFSYQNRKDAKVLENIDFTLTGHETVALVGQTGSGKSTIASLLTRLYEPTEGNIYLDGKPIHKYCPKWLREKVISVVSQEPKLFATSIKENIRYGNPKATDQEIYEAAEKANCTEFISKLPSGFDTFVGERGSQLSGGQKQRVAIARALVKQPYVLILDEATSALDSESEKLVQGALNNASTGRSVLVIAHRLSTVKNADKILVLDGGKIIETGDHKTLVAKGGRYAKLVESQNFKN